MSFSASASNFALNHGPTLMSQQIILGLNLVGFGISLASPHMHTHVDLLGTGAFAASTLPSLLAKDLPGRILWTSAAVATWSVKLASYLFYRVLQRGHDSRLDSIMENPLWCAGFWTYSALWGIVCSLPYSLGLAATTHPGNPLLVRAGLGIFGAGLLIETLADYQKLAFKRSGKPGFCNEGLWSISQHPNYFGNFVLWLGILVSNWTVLVDPLKQVTVDPSLWQRVWAYRRLALALVGPAFMWRLFDAQASGSLLPDSFEATRKKNGYGTNPEYTRYIDGKHCCGTMTTFYYVVTYRTSTGLWWSYTNQPTHDFTPHLISSQKHPKSFPILCSGSSKRRNDRNNVPSIDYISINTSNLKAGHGSRDEVGRNVRSKSDHCETGVLSIQQ